MSEIKNISRIAIGKGTLKAVSNKLKGSNSMTKEEIESLKGYIDKSIKEIEEV